ncbi:MBL fold metallo-hydrolase [Rubrivirga sp.]|uniref:MBL fold metallo-hydrolase n=1 Tax=Rubrivirga sp. TaxID=1885344 RepID=UPI003C73A173
MSSGVEDENHSGNSSSRTSPALTVTLLGTGTSTGVPVIGCACAVCTSDDPRDARLRTSAHIVAHASGGDVHVQVDVGPDFRTQALRAGLEAVDGLVVTHEHFDHVTGLDDLRPFFFKERSTVPVFARPGTADALRAMFRYVFDRTYPGASLLDLHPVDGPFTVGSRTNGGTVEVTPITAPHGDFEVMGVRIGGFAYLTDVGSVPDAARAVLEGVDTLVLDGLRPEPHPTHLTFLEAAAVAKDVGARQTWLTHVTHNALHAEVDATLPDGVRLAYDGLVLEVEANSR